LRQTIQALTSGNAGWGLARFSSTAAVRSRVGALWAHWSLRHGGMGRDERFGSIRSGLAG